MSFTERMQDAADWAGVFTELRGYVAEAVADGGVIQPAELLAYMDDVRSRRVLQPMDTVVRDWTEASLQAAEGEA